MEKLEKWYQNHLGMEMIERTDEEFAIECLPVCGGRAVDYNMGASNTINAGFGITFR